LIEVLEKKLRNLALKKGERLSDGPVAANPPVTTKKQNQARHQGSVPSAPGTKRNKEAGKAQAKEKEKNNKARNTKSAGSNWMDK
jgi:hypothetical protein